MSKLSRCWFLLAAVAAVACGGSSSTSLDTADGQPLDALEAVADALEVIPDEGPSDPGVDVPTCSVDADCEGKLPGGPCRRVRCSDEGLCLAQPVADHALCDDGDKCTVGDACLAGECVGGAPVDCDDDDPCTDDQCDPGADARGCVHLPSTGSPCDDGNLCTTGDACDAGTCRGDDGACACTADADCRPFDDANLCNGTLACDAGTCRVAPGTVIHCPTAWDGPCVRTTCQPHSGACVTNPLDEGVDCDDGNPCTVGDACQGGSCTAGDYACQPCTADAECAPFDDADLCNGLVRCLEGRCQVGPGTVVACPSTVDTPCRKTLCQPSSGSCQAVLRDDGDACSDSNRCTTGDRCQSGQCAPAGQVACDDGDPCTDDACDPAAGCVFAAAPKACDDGDACTLDDHCVEGSCAGGAVRACDDGNPCTTEACDPAAGCVFSSNDLPCDDGNPCTVGDQCVGGACVAGANGCACAADADCRPYDDDDLCNGALACVDGHCTPAAGSVVVCSPSGDTQCRVNTCDPITGACAFQRRDDGTPCAAGDACSVGDACFDGVCVAGGERICGDGDPCTSDGCDPTTGCVHVPVVPCAGCVADADCLDTDPCTVDTCTAGDCAHAPAPDGPCDDGNPCTGGDHCQAGACLSGDAALCAGQACHASTALACEHVVHADLAGEGVPSELSGYGCSPFEFVGPEHVYRFTPGASGPVTLQLSDAANLYLLLLEDEGLGCDTSSCPAAHPARVTWNAVAGTSYYVVVEGFGGFAASYSLALDCSWATPEACANGLDDDVDGAADCDDPDCAADAACFEAACADHVDGDHDGVTDCDDPDCFFDAVCTGGWSGETCEESFLLGGGGPIVLGGAAPATLTLARRFTTAGRADDHAGLCQGDGSGADVAYVLPLAQPALALIQAAFLDDDVATDLMVYSAPVCLPDYQAACAASPQGLERLYLPAGDTWIVVDGGGHAPDAFQLTVALSLPPSDEAFGQCEDGVDNDYDGATDCDDSGTCGATPWCSAAGQCVPVEPAAWPSSVSTVQGRRELATNVISQYACPSGLQADYTGPEAAWRYRAPCTGRATATLTAKTGPVALIDLFLLDAAEGCQGGACLAFAASAGGVAELAFDVVEGAAFDLVADGLLEATGDLALSMQTTCDERCDNALDDDLDGLTDCDDVPDCPEGTVDCPAAYETDCGDAVDNDADGLTDCDDLDDCQGAPGCLPLFETRCADGLDDDLDGDTDCADADCIGTASCPELDCVNGLDDDADGPTDCDDADCKALPWCATAPACVRAASLTCGEPQAVNLRANDSTRVLSAWPCDAFNQAYAGPEHAWTFVAPCTGQLPVRASRLTTSTWFDLFVLPGAGPCAASACTGVLYFDALEKAVAGTVPVVQGQSYTLVVDSWLGVEPQVQVQVDCTCQ